MHTACRGGPLPACLQVTAESGRLMVGLGWYGRVLDGALHGSVKTKELHWCLEDQEVRRHHQALAAPPAPGACQPARTRTAGTPAAAGCCPRPC